jgi:predicted alpha/beta superfamily hydrolase
MKLLNYLCVFAVLSFVAPFKTYAQQSSVTKDFTIRQSDKEMIDSTIPKVSSGKLVRYKVLHSRYAQPRNVDIWLPENYDKSKRYAVLYMHDGQMLFDSTTTWNGQEWQVDEHMSNLLNRKVIRNCIVVGIWNNGKYRHTEYFPQKALEYLPPAVKDSLTRQLLDGKPQADNYLRFLVKELKPFVDSVFTTIPDKENTFIAGSSMGGLISMYALCEYPEVFGGAACLSTHWIGNFQKNDEIPAAFAQYIKTSLPPAVDHKFYFDYGTVGLDSLYKPYQLKINSILATKGYTTKSWKTKEFKGADHSEKSWNKRLDIPLLFLLKR